MILPIEFLFGLHFVGYGTVAIYDIESGKERVWHRTHLWSFKPNAHRLDPDVVWNPTTGDLYVAGPKGGQEWEDVS